MSLPLTLPLPWSCTDRNVRVQKIFNGYLRVTNENFLDAYENPNSTEFVELASKVKEAVSHVLGWSPVLAASPWAGVGHGRAPGPRTEGAAWAGGRGTGLTEPPLFPQLKQLYSEIPVLGPYYKESTVTAFRWVLRRRGGAGGAGEGVLGMGSVRCCWGTSAWWSAG